MNRAALLPQHERVYSDNLFWGVAVAKVNDKSKVRVNWVACRNQRLRDKYCLSVVTIVWQNKGVATKNCRNFYLSIF